MSALCFEAINWSPYFWTADLPGGPPRAERVVEAAAAAGFPWISFDEKLLAAEQAAGRSIASLRRRVEQAGLRVLAVHALALSDDLESTSAAARALAPAAAELGAPWVQAGATSPIGPALYASTRAAASIVGAAGARLAIEFLPFLPVASIADTRALVAETEPGALRAAIVPDTWHFFHGPDDWEALASLSPDEIAYLQFDDHPPLASDDLLVETTQRRVLPGRGEFDLERFARTFRTNGFDGVVGLEHLSAADRARPVEAVARELVEAAGRYW
ncbi:MAG: sugar phosphate isomerase/epimerase [Spirochaetaceae bacterium]|nr:sugar phosphate isomerase/epimerase [Spirochaetaceae bacterium]HPG24816.1 TIM barrel protein [Myxococcota bacterium]